MLNRLLGALRREETAVAEPALTSLLEDVARAIPGANPCGDDVSYDPDFLRLKEEIDKLNAVDTRVDQEKAAELSRQLRANGSRAAHAPSEKDETTDARRPMAMDADFVISAARMILSGKSKDLRVVSYLALGLARRDGLAGLAEGTTAYALLVESYWDGLYPPLKRMTGRKNAIEVGVRWLVEVLEGITPAANDREALEQARAAVESLTAAFAARALPDLVLQLTMLDAKVRELLGRVPAPRPEIAPPSGPEASARTTNASEASAPAHVGHEQPASNGVSRTVPDGVVQPQSAAQAAELVIRAATWMRKEDARRAAAYRLVRSLRWDALAGEPPNDRRKTAIEAPPAARREYLLGLQKRDAWEELLREAEASFSQPPFHFWLDLQRLVVAALDGMGAEYAFARDVVVREVQLLANRLPGLATLLFADGRTRFADAATVAWLESITRPTTATPPNARDAVAAPRTNGGLASRFAEPRKRFNDGDLAGALALLQRGRGDDASQHDRFLRRLYAAMLCLEAGQLSVARALLEELDEAIETHRLEQWDPALALDVWTRLYTCYVAQASRGARGGDVQQLGRDMQRVFARICRVDTARALAATQEAGHPKQ